MLMAEKFSAEGSLHVDNYQV